MFTFSGELKSGKGTAMEILSQLLYGLDRPTATVTVAKNLKAEVSQILGIPLLDCYSQEGKEKIVKAPGGREVRLRQYLQDYGESMKQVFGKLYWINQCIRDAQSLKTSNITPLCEDARFDFEINAFKENGGIAINIHRINPEKLANPSDPIYNHPSETDIPASNDPIYDHVIDNNGTIEELKEKLQKIVALYYGKSK